MHKRKLSHLNELNKGTHCNGHLQNAYNLDKDYFTFVPVENTSTSDLNAREVFWLNQFERSDLYNIDTVGADGEKWEASEEFKKEIGERTRKVMEDENIRVKVSIKKRKLEPEQINEVRRRYLNWEKAVDIAVSLNVTADVVGQITRGVRCAIGPGIDKDLVEKAIARPRSKKT